MRATVARMRAGESTTTTDGKEAWAAGPSDLTPVTVFALVKDSLEGARLDAQLLSPARSSRS